MNFIRKHISSFIGDDNVAAYQFKNTKTLRMALGCYILGKYCMMDFPNAVHEHRASFELLPLLILVTIFLSIPLTFASLGISQYSKEGWITVWDAEPVWRGIGFAGIICLYISISQNYSLCTDFFYYTMRSLESEMPWAKCDENQNFEEEGCFTYADNRSIRLDCLSMHDEEHCDNIIWKNSAQYFWENSVTYSKAKVDTFRFNPNLLPYELAVELFVYIFIRHSTESVAMFSPFLLIFPTIMQAILLVRSFLHPGALRGLDALFDFKISNLMSMEFWLDFTALSLHSTGFAYGGLANFGSHFSFRHPINIDAVFINLICVTYSILYAVYKHNLYGILSYELNLTLSEVVDIDEDDSFVQCALSFIRIKHSKLWSILYYSSNFLVIFRSLGLQCEMFLCTFYELKPSLKRYTMACALVFCFTHFLFNILLNTNIINELFMHTNMMVMLLVVPILVFYFYVFLSFFYGVMHFVDDMHFMLGFRASNIWQLNWYLGFLIYSFIITMCFYSFGKELKEMSSLEYYNSIFLLICLVLFPIIYLIIFVTVQRRKKISYGVIFRSAIKWGPRDELLRKSRDMFSAHDMTKEYLYRQRKLKSRASEVVPTKSSSDVVVDN